MQQSPLTGTPGLAWPEGGGRAEHLPSQGDADVQREMGRSPGPRVGKA